MSRMPAIAKPAPTRPRAGVKPPEELAVVHLVAEYWPYARTGGLAEAVRGIATFQAAQGTPVTVFMPLYRSVREAFPDLEPIADSFRVRVGRRVEEVRILQHPGPRRNPRVLFVDQPGCFDRDGIYGEGGSDYGDNPLRFALYNLAALRILPELANAPVVVHAHDWHAALAPVFLRTRFAGREAHDRMAAVLSIHNAGYQGLQGPEVLEEIGLPRELFHWRLMEFYGHLNLLKGGLVFADYATTVSPTHAHELRTADGGFGLHGSFIEMGDRFLGILNGVDLEVWDPETDPEIAATFSSADLAGKAVCKRALQREYSLTEAPRVPLYGMTARLVAQKGIDLLIDGGPLERAEGQFIFLGQGEERYETALRELAARHPDRIAVDTEFADAKEHRLLAGIDLLLMPSLYEPCGLTQMRAQLYGVLPVARRVGGLADTIEDQVTGFLFDGYTSEDLEIALGRAAALYAGSPEAWNEHAVQAMARDFGWASSAGRYLDVYRRALAAHAPGD
ncbi:MAG: glycogen synthase [Gemmatimonadales bacterium]|nr:glycogen synthase [Gemmatimonadales bacterium]MYG19800.1 glycogen synthase [Gemmatimonadales bacterium]